MSKAMIQLDHIDVTFQQKKRQIQAVKDVTIHINEGDIYGIVGYSGAGKSTLVRVINLLQVPSAGTITVDGDVIYQDQVTLKPATLREKRRDIGMIFQDPLASLNPLMTIGAQIDEALLYHTDLDEKQRTERVLELLAQVGIPNPQRTFKQYPHELSGGMRQRVVIAIALSCKPPIIIADEPTTALDVTIQAQILDLLNEIQAETQSGIILITHDLGVVAETADRVAVMYAGQFVEIAPVEELFTNPKHPYTRSLLQSIPQAGSEGQELHVIEGTVPPLPSLPRTGCRFAPRIPWISAEEHEENPTLHEVGKGHFVRCTCYKNFHFEGEEA